MKKILIFGDSNTFGYIPAGQGRYDKTLRWSGILKTLCADKFQIIEEGCNNRTAFSDNPSGLMQTGYKVLPSMLNNEIEGIILAVGINDLQPQYNVTLENYQKGLEKLVDIAYSCAPNAKIILATPAQLTENIFNDRIFSVLFDKTSIEKSHFLSEIFAKVAAEKNCYLIDWNNFVKVSPKDGLHLEPEAHKIIAEKTYELLNNIMM